MKRRPRPKTFEDFDEKMIDHIVAQVRHPAADKVDKAALLEDLLDCYDRTFRLFPQRSKSTIKDQQTRWNSMCKHIGWLVGGIEEDNAALGVASKILADLIEANTADQNAVREGAGLWSDVLDGLLRAWAIQLEALSTMKPADFVKEIRERHGICVDEVIMRKLTGEWLPEVFEKHFKPLKARPSRLVKGGYSGPPTGPYIRFAMAVLTAWKLAYSQEAITAAVQRGKKI
jgi:hypothetical protein